MIYRESTEYGDIKYGNAVPGSIVKHVASQMGGRVLLSTPKGRPLKSGSHSAADETAFIETEMSKDSIDMTLYIVLRFGVSINTAVSEFTEGIRKELPLIMGVKPNLIKVVVTGVLSKNLSKRNIVVETYADVDSSG